MAASSMPENVPLALPSIDTRDVAAVTDTLRSGRISLGPALSDFENALARVCDTNAAVATSSGTTGLQLALGAVGVESADEVITTAFTFVATANAIHHAGATPVFVDICPDTLNIDPGLIEQAITPATKAILVVHVFGRPADMTAILEIARRHDLAVIEDACEALGTRIGERPAGSFGSAGVFGFYPNKVITCGEGGAVVSDNSDVIEYCRSMRNHGRTGGDMPFGGQSPGHNFRLSDLQAALGLAQLSRLEDFIARRSTLFDAYRERLADVDRLLLPAPAPEGVTISWFVYVVRLAGEIEPGERNTLREQLAEDGIATGYYFPAIHRMPAYQAHDRCRFDSLPHTEEASRRVMALPFYPEMTDAQLDQVCASLQRHLG